MKKIAVFFMAIAIIMLGTGILNHVAHALVQKQLRMDSQPAGAEVYLLRGTRKLPLGKTPLVHTIEFHSEMSVIRIHFQKAAHKPLTLEVSASQDAVVARLEALTLTAAPEDQADPDLRRIQGELNPVIERTMVAILEKAGSKGLQISSPIRAVREGTMICVMVPVIMQNFEGKITGTGRERHEMILKTIWDRLGAALLVPLALKIRNHSEISGVLLEARFDELQYLFRVSPGVGTKTEMECVGGQKQMSVFNPCKTRELYYSASGMAQTLCIPGLDLQTVWDPCLYRRPVVKTFVKMDPKASVSKQHGSALYYLPLKALARESSSEQIYHQLGIALIDSKGKALIRSGVIPDALY